MNDPGAIRRVLLENAANYQKDSFQRRVLSPGLGDGLLSAEGAQWKTQRRIVVAGICPQDHHGFRARDDGRDRCADRALAPARCLQVVVAAEMTRVTLDVLERTIFSDGLGRERENFRLAMGTYFNTIGRIDPLDLFAVPSFVPRLSQLRVRSTLRFFESAIDEIIAKRLQRGREPHSDNAADILTLLLGALDPDTGQQMSEAEVRSNILTFIAAGHETTANLLSWSLFLLSQSAQWRQRVEAKAERESGGPAAGLADRLVETRAVIDEAARLYPPIAAISRVAMGPDELCGECVRRGSLIVIAPYVLHRHKLLWRDPNAFDPARFLGAASAEYDRYAYIPLGAGARTCIGATFALQEATLVLAAVMKNFDLGMAADADVRPLLRVTLRPAGGLPMTVRHKRVHGASAEMTGVIPA